MFFATVRVVIKLFKITKISCHQRIFIDYEVLVGAVDEDDVDNIGLWQICIHIEGVTCTISVHFIGQRCIPASSEEV